MTDSDGNVFPKAPSLVDISDKFTYALTFGSGNIKAYYDRTSGTVRGTLSVYNTTTNVFNMSTPMFTIASGYRPSASVTVPMAIESLFNGSATWQGYRGSIGSNGDIVQGMTSNGHQCYCYFEYSL